MLHWKKTKNKKKNRAISPTSQLQCCLCETAEWTSEHHAPHSTSLPPPRKIILCSPWADWTPPPAKLKTMNTELQSNTDRRGGGGILNLPQRTGMGQGAEFSALNSHWTNVGKPSNAENGDRATNQSSRGAVNTQLRSGKTQRLWVGLGQQDNVPKQGRWWILELISGIEGSIQNWIAPPCWGRSWQNRTAAEGQRSCCLVKTIALTIPHTSCQSLLTSQFNLSCVQMDEILLTSQSPGETTSEFLFVHQYQDWTPKE
jgi:hypothetical protein